VKHYYAREALSKSKDEPLRHPKLGVSYQTSRWDETLRFHELEQLNDELDEAVISVLRDAGLCTHAADQFVSDAYFEAKVRDRPEVAELDLDQIQHEQENVVIRFLADGGFSPVEEEAVATLLADGGEVSPSHIADKNGRNVDSVRRALVSYRRNGTRGHTGGERVRQQSPPSGRHGDSSGEARTR
jgi:ribosomal protein L15